MLPNNSATPAIAITDHTEELFVTLEQALSAAADTS
jgi:hypothetical protein